MKMKINFLINLAENLDESIFNSWEEAVDNYYNKINFPSTLHSDFFSLHYLITKGEYGLIIDEKEYGSDVIDEIRFFFPHEDWLFDNIIDSDKSSLKNRSEDLGEYLYCFYESVKNTKIGDLFIETYKNRLVNDLVSELFIYTTREELINVLGDTYYLLRKYNLI